MADELEPCPDEGCAGVIGPDGNCTVCGASGTDAGDSLETDSDEGDLDDREPCLDGACIGIIGQDGRCTECGTRSPRGPGGPMRQRPTGDDRQPCPDGACIGVIGEDGRCTECGGGPGGGFDDGGDDGDDDWDDGGGGGGGFDPDDREPCPDGACIGIIGSNGRCTECGRRRS